MADDAPPPSPRQVVLDDTDPNIVYGGPGWTATAGNATKDFGVLGPAYNNTLHQANTADANLTFEFEGTGFTIFGLSNNNDPNSANPLLCYLDGSPIDVAPGPSTALCGVSNITDAKHDVVVKAPQGVFYLDYATYTPSPNVSLSNAVVLIPNDDASLSYSGIWNPEVADLPGPMTLTEGSQLSFPFYGKSVAFFAVILHDSNGDPSLGSYVIDDLPPTEFNITGNSISHTNVNLYNQLLFTTPDVQPGQHKLTVTYQGDANTTYLVLDYLTVANASDPQPTPSQTHTLDTPSLSISSSPTSAAQSPTDGHGSTSRNIIIGCVVGGVALLVCVALLACWLRRRRAFWADDHADEESTNKIESEDAPRPFTIFSTDLATDTSGTSPTSRRSKVVPRASSPVAGGDSNETLAISLEPPPTSVVIHEDSGLRLKKPLVDLPPKYTPH